MLVIKFIEIEAWVWRRRLLAWEEESVRECSILLHNIVLQNNVHDTWRWYLDPTHGYSVRVAYRFITTYGEPSDSIHDDNVWHRLIPANVSLFVWRLLRNRLPTKDNLVRRRVLPLDSAVCVSGCGEQKSANHLFLKCVHLSSIWSQVWLWLGISSVLPGDIRHHLRQFSNMAGLPRATYIFMKIIWFASVWVLWKERNN